MKNIRTLLVMGALAFTASGCEHIYYLTLNNMFIKTYCDDGECTTGTYRTAEFKDLIGAEVTCRERQLVERTFTSGTKSEKLQVCPNYYFTQNDVQSDPRVETAALTGYRISIPVSKPGAFGNIALDLSNARESQINYTDTKVATCDVLGTNLPRKVFTIDYRNQAIRLAAPADSVTCEFPAPLQQAIVAVPDRG